MFPKETALRILQRCLSGKGKKIFRNQVQFYNIVFGVTNGENCPEKWIQIMLSQKKEEADAAEIRDVNQFLESGLDNSSSNVGKHINDEPRMSIPKQHCIHFSQSEKRKEIERRLWAAVSYCARDSRYREPIGEDELQELCKSLKEKLAWASDTLRKTETLDYRLLANVIYEVVQTHLGSRRRNRDLTVRTELPKAVDMNQQIREYYLTCDCYEVNSVDFFFALRRMASKNVIASSNLGGFYYVGMEFVVKNEGGGNDGRYIVERNLDQAAYYFKCAADSDPSYAPAAYSIGYMYFHREVCHMEYEKQRKEAVRYLRMAAEQNFHHAICALGDVALSDMEPVLERWELGETAVFGRVTEALRTALIQYDKGAEVGSLFGHSKVVRLLEEPRYAPFMDAVLTDLPLIGGTDIRERWRRMAEAENVWAMDELGQLEHRAGNWKQAKAWFERAEEYNYPESAYHLAVFIYGPKGSMPEKASYVQCLEKASKDGSAAGSLALARMTAEKDRSLALTYLELAREQNYEKFRYDLYMEIRKLIKQWKTEEQV